MYSPMDPDVIHQEISEFISIPTTSSCDEENFLNTRERTLALIELYKKYKPKVGTSQVKSMRRLWEIVARDLSNQLKITISAARCENRWKTLERNYKKVVDNNNKTGRDRKVFEYEEEFDTIYGKKKNISPSVLLSSNSSISTPNRAKGTPENSQDRLGSSSHRQNVLDYLCSSSQVFVSIPEETQNENVDTLTTTTVQNTEEPAQLKRKVSIRKVTSSYKKRNDILVEMKNDLKKYYEQKSKRDEQRLELERKKYEERVKRTKILETILGENQ